MLFLYYFFVVIFSAIFLYFQACSLSLFTLSLTMSLCCTTWSCHARYEYNLLDIFSFLLTFFFVTVLWFCWFSIYGFLDLFVCFWFCQIFPLLTTTRTMTTFNTEIYLRANVLYICMYFMYLYIASILVLLWYHFIAFPLPNSHFFHLISTNRKFPSSSLLYYMYYIYINICIIYMYTYICYIYIFIERSLWVRKNVDELICFCLFDNLYNIMYRNCI